MHRYAIHHRIDTMLMLYNPFEINGFKFESWENDNWTGKGGWVVRKEVEASTVLDAFRKFYEQLSPVVDRIAIAGQCYTSIHQQTMAIIRDNDDRFFSRYSKNIDSARLSFGEEQVKSLRSLVESSPLGNAFPYLHEAINTTTFYSQLAMLCSSLEGLAGEVQKNKTNRDYIRDEILQDPILFERLFKHGTGIRNQVLHGKYIGDDLHSDEDYNEEIYKKIVDYLNRKYCAGIGKMAVRVPRTRFGEVEFYGGFFRWVSRENKFSLRLFHCALESRQPSPHFEEINCQDSINYDQLLDSDG